MSVPLAEANVKRTSKLWGVEEARRRGGSTRVMGVTAATVASTHSVASSPTYGRPPELTSHTNS